MTWFEQALRCLLCILVFSSVIIGIAALYTWVVALFDIDDLNDLEIEDDEVA